MNSSLGLVLMTLTHQSTLIISIDDSPTNLGLPLRLWSYPSNSAFFCLFFRLFSAFPLFLGAEPDLSKFSLTPTNQQKKTLYNSSGPQNFYLQRPFSN
jgi:hypothetical protein